MCSDSVQIWTEVRRSSQGLGQTLWPCTLQRWGGPSSEFGLMSKTAVTTWILREYVQASYSRQGRLLSKLKNVLRT